MKQNLLNVLVAKVLCMHITHLKFVRSTANSCCDLSIFCSNSQ
jgi:hypothetical protein